uniref:Uncharacterized protein n=1 Tax=Amphimedon queenslandica TaxID=400682 RepID=A0A1X7V0S0_AMPQE
MEIKDYQNFPYNLKACDLCEIPNIKGLMTIHDFEHFLYKQSKRIEPSNGTPHKKPNNKVMMSYLCNAIPIMNTSTVVGATEKICDPDLVFSLEKTFGNCRAS